MDNLDFLQHHKTYISLNLKNKDIRYYAELLKNGEVIAFPTETVYGLGASAWNPSAIQKVFETKGRPNDNPLIVHVSSKAMVKDFALVIPGEAKKLMDAFWPGPLTMIFKKKPEVLDQITAGLNTIAVRMPNHQKALNLIEQAGPLVAPSANTSGRPSPTNAQHVKDDFGNDFPVLDGGNCPLGLESTVLNVSDKPFEILRPGYIHKSEIEEILGFSIKTHEMEETTDKPRSPGMKYSHYTPSAEVRWLKPGENLGNKTALYLLHDEVISSSNHHIIHYNHDYEKMARELYDRFRQADRVGFKQVIIEKFSNKIRNNTSLVEALNNRISKAIGLD